jgi:hypothetical protein
LLLQLQLLLLLLLLLLLQRALIDAVASAAGLNAAVMQQRARKMCANACTASQ